MTRLPVAMGLMMLSGTAWAWESEPVPLVFDDNFPLLDALYFDTGWFPSEDPLGVRFYILPKGGVITNFECESNLVWPDALTHVVTCDPMSGEFGFDTQVEIAAELHYDIGIADDYVDLWSDGFAITETTSYTPMLLNGSSQESVTATLNAPDLIDPIVIDLDIISGVVGVAFELRIWPQFTATANHGQLTTSHESGVVSMVDAGQVVTFPAPTQGGGLSHQVSLYEMDLDTAFDLVLRPSVWLTSIVGDFEILGVDIPVNILTLQDTRLFDPVVYEHPLPALKPPAPSYDLGKVEVGSLKNQPVPFASIGMMDLEGTVSITGSDAYTVFPEYIKAAAGTTDGVMITFVPSAVGAENALLTIETNDPLRPLIEIPITGTGFELTDDPDSTDENGEPTGDGDGGVDNYDDGFADGYNDAKSKINTCGCSTGAGSAAGGWMVLAMAAGLWRRRRG